MPVGTIRPRTRLQRFTLRSLFVVVTLFAVLFALWSREERRYARELKALEHVGRLGVSYSFEDRAPRWLRRLVGDDRLVALKTVSSISYPPEGAHMGFADGSSASALGASDSELAEMRSWLESLRYLETLNIADSSVTDTGLAQLEGLRNLRKLHAANTSITNRGIEALRQKTPMLDIEH